MEDTGTIARPYALAAFDQARETASVAEWAAMLETLETICQDPAVEGLVVNPRIDSPRVAELIVDIAGNRLSDQAQNFVALLAEYERLGLVSEIREIFERQRAELEGRGEVEVLTAYPLTSEQEGRISDAVSRRLGVSVTLTVEIDETLIGGVVIRAGDLVIDASLRGRLNHLRQSLT